MKNIKIHLLSLLLITVIVFPLVTLASGSNTPNPGGGSNDPKISVNISNPFNCGQADNDNCTLMSLITAILERVIMPVAAVGVVLWIIWSGFQFVIAQGKPADLETARQNLLWSLIGAGVLLGAAAIAKVVELTVRELLNYR